MNGYLIDGLAGVGLVANAHKPVMRHPQLSVPSFAAGWLTTETAPMLLGSHALNTLRAVRGGALRSGTGRVAVAAHVATMVGAGSLIAGGLRTDEEFTAALAAKISMADLEARPRSVRAGAVLPFINGRSKRSITRTVPYGEHGWRNTLDVYEPPGRPADGERRPAILQVHGGAWIIGDKNQQGIPLLNHLAANGWVGFNINYRLAPRSPMPTQLIDVKTALAWIKEHADEYHIDPDFVCVTGGSAGGHLSSMVALTANDPEFQPGFEDVDTSVAAAVPFYGVYDLLDRENAMMPGFRDFVAENVMRTDHVEDADAWSRNSPVDRVHPDVPPMMVIHGALDSLVPVEQARQLVAKLHATSEHDVTYVELAGAQHAFDIFGSPRTVRTIEYVERYLNAVRLGEIK